MKNIVLKLLETRKTETYPFEKLENKIFKHGNEPLMYEAPGVKKLFNKFC